MEPSDTELVAAAKSGETRAFDSLMRRYERLVFRVAAGFEANREDALDLVQTVFLKAFRSLDGFRSEASFKTWLLRIAYHEGLNASRSRQRQPPTDELVEGTPELVAPASQEDALLAADRRGLIGRALAALNGRYRTAIVLRYQHGLPIRDIAAVLDTSEPMTKNLLFRGVRQLRSALADSR